MALHKIVIPAKAGIHLPHCKFRLQVMDSRLRGNDEGGRINIMSTLPVIGVANPPLPRYRRSAKKSLNSAPASPAPSPS